MVRVEIPGVQTVGCVNDGTGLELHPRGLRLIARVLIMRVSSPSSPMTQDSSEARLQSVRDLWIRKFTTVLHSGILEKWTGAYIINWPLKLCSPFVLTTFQVVSCTEPDCVSFSL